MLRILSIFPCLLCLASAAPLPLGQGPSATMVEDTPARTTVNAIPDGRNQGPAGDLPLAVLRIDWLNNEPTPKDFEVTVTDKQKVITTTYRQGATGITRTLLATPEIIFLHFVADQPGAISFKTTLGSPRDGTTAVQNRNELTWTSARAPAMKAYARVIPFESDVETEGDSIVLRGEGECMVIFSFTRLDDAAKPLSGTWKRLAAALDPGAEHPDPVKIWQTILAHGGAP
ncbi:hypothetical protein OVA24_05435 [Luteolibacter sp. SL250]|uniref:hypothetical protein n=1 Tax=Luteolibacter sp. SL250 TaxID=2995170 RepID=UPI002270B332|nr:hypothetical protein [Luteolibacter sp. SL250]WAC20824.1 hypothetical protein OVA24_05435 [Luteolibacter sp. SL250]